MLSINVVMVLVTLISPAHADEQNATVQTDTAPIENPPLPRPKPSLLDATGDNPAEMISAFRQSGHHSFGPLEVFSNGSGLYDPLFFSSSEGPSNAHIGRSILRRADITSRHRYREPEGRQWQIHVCHAHHCRAA